MVARAGRRSRRLSAFGIIEDALEARAMELEASGRYKVLRRLQFGGHAPFEGALSLGDGVRLAVYLDLETTGLDPRRDEVIEIALVPFAYGADGRILATFEPFESFIEPGGPISPDITALTGITDEMVKGARLDLAALEAMVARASLIIAHNAAFDRRFAERMSPVFASRAWACSMREIDWAAEGFEGTKLGYLAAGAGFFYDRHRALSDCLAALELLRRPLPRSGTPAFARLLERARKAQIRLYAENTPFETKDLLKARGYRWNGDGNGRPRAWYVDLDEEAKADELAFLEREIYRREADVTLVRLTARDRYSERV